MDQAIRSKAFQMTGEVSYQSVSLPPPPSSTTSIWKWHLILFLEESQGSKGTQRSERKHG